MKSNVGIWLDHRKAFIVRERDGVEETHALVSDVEKHVRFPAEDRRIRWNTGLRTT